MKEKQNKSSERKMDIVGAKEMDMLNQFHFLMMSESKNIFIKKNPWNYNLGPAQSVVKRRNANNCACHPRLPEIRADSSSIE